MILLTAFCMCSASYATVLQLGRINLQIQVIRVAFSSMGQPDTDDPVCKNKI